jgi:uncharacterized protein (TIGR00369 family)
MSQDHAATVSALSDGWVKAMGVRFVRANPDEVVAELDVTDVHRQPLGMVHGGVFSGLVETVASIGAGINAMMAGKLSVGIENHTSFLHAVRRGTLRATARPLARGARTHVWEATITDESGRIVASGRVRLLVLEPGSSVAGEGVALRE